MPSISRQYVPQLSTARFAAKAQQAVSASVGDSSNINHQSTKQDRYLPCSISGPSEEEKEAGVVAGPEVAHTVYTLTNIGGRKGITRGPLPQRHALNFVV